MHVTKRAATTPGSGHPPPSRAPQIQPGGLRRRRGHPSHVLRQHRARHAEFLDGIPAQDLFGVEYSAVDAVFRGGNARFAECRARAAFAAEGWAAAGAEVEMEG